VTVEIKGQQLRIRMEDPKKFVKSSFRTQALGTKGRLQRVAGRIKPTGAWKTQAWRLNLSDYKSRKEVRRTLQQLYLRGLIKQPQYFGALKKIKKVM